MERKSLAGFVLAFLAASHAPAWAGGEKGSWELGLFGGYAFLDDYSGGPVALDPDDDALFGARVGWFASPAWSVELSWQQLSSTTGFPMPTPNVSFDIDSIRLNGLYNFRPGQTLRPFLAFGAGLETTEVGGVDTDDAGLNAGGGLRWYLGEHFGLRLDGRYVYTDIGGAIDKGQSNFETTGGLLFTFGGGPPPDTDGDGVGDGRDKCPDTPHGATVDERGCPTDADGDGVFGGIDRCPDTPTGCKVDDEGCPLDSDGDGVIDCQDSCAGTAKGCKVDASGCTEDEDDDGVCDGADKCARTGKGCQVDASGCPADTDNDRVCEGLDKCPGSAQGCRIDPNGCTTDEDKDGVCDGTDRCPGTPASRRVDELGCEVLFDKDRASLVLEGVNFEHDSDRLTPGSRARLDSVAASLREWSDVRVQVEGHTDSAGDDDYNLRLSQRRAEAVRAYLVAKGVDASRLSAEGYGETKPMADNGTADGRARNRRVELARLD